MVVCEEIRDAKQEEKVLQRAVKCRSGLLEPGETNPLGDAQGQQKKAGGNNWMSRIKQELERMGVGDMLENGRNNSKKVWI
jgi:hypothetical protein